MSIEAKRAEFHANREISQNLDNAGNGIDLSLEDVLFERSLERENHSIRVEDTHSSAKAKASARALKEIEIRREEQDLFDEIDFI